MIMFLVLICVSFFFLQRKEKQAGGNGNFSMLGQQIAGTQTLQQQTQLQQRQQQEQRQRPEASPGIGQMNPHTPSQQHPVQVAQGIHPSQMNPQQQQLVINRTTDEAKRMRMMQANQ